MARQSSTSSTIPVRRGERGVALVLVLIVLSTLLVGGLVATGLRMINIRTSGASLAAKRAFYCAEAGLDAGRDFFRQNSASWGTYLSTAFVYTGTTAATGGLPFAVRISDNADEFPPLANDPLVDRDYTVVLQASCTDPILQSVVTLQQHLTLNPLVDPPAPAIVVGPVTYTTTADFTAGAGTDMSGNLAMATPTVAATAVDLRMDRLVLQPGMMLGSWTVRRYCGASCNGWASVAWTATQPMGTLVTVRARSAPALTGLGTAAWVPLMSGVPAPPIGAGSLRGRFVEVDVILQSAVAGLSPIVDSVTVTPY
jgi:hypothetical protein